MSIRTLEQAFNAVFHKKDNFTNFCSLDLAQHVKEILFDKQKVYRTTKTLKYYLRFIDRVMLRHLAKNDVVVHSYTKGKSVLTAVKSHAENRDFFLTDIKSFFSNITEGDVERILIRDKCIIPISDLDTYIVDIAKMVTWDGAIPIGFPTSPQLSNGFLFEFDNALHDWCKAHELSFTRYSDDIIISGKDKKLIADLRDPVQDMLHQYASKKFFLNEKKTRITHIGNKVKILGLVITQDGRVTVDSKYKRTLESLLHFYVTDTSRYNNYLNKVLEGKERSLFGLLHYVKSIDLAYLEKLQRKYGVFALRTLMENRWRDD